MSDSDHVRAWCDNAGESLALVLRKGSAGSNTVADHIEVLDEAIVQIPARYRRDLLITVNGASSSHGLLDHITTLNASPWRQVHYSTGWDLGARERVAIGRVPKARMGPCARHRRARRLRVTAATRSATSQVLSA